MCAAIPCRGRGAWGLPLTNGDTADEANRAADQPAGWSQRLAAFNATDADYPSAAPIHRLIEDQVDRTPEAIAVRDGSMAVSYGELDRRANQLAAHLEAQGVRAASRVGILLPHSVETIVAILAVLKTGAAFVPLDVDHPASRLTQILADAGVGLLVTNAAVGPAGGPWKALPVDTYRLAIAVRPDTRPPRRTDANDAAYVIYTSGSTGAPRGVVVAHRSLVNYVWWANGVYTDRRPEAFALFTSLAFDLTLTSIFCPLTTGGTVIAYQPRKGESMIVAVLRDDQARVVKLTPSHLSIAAAQPDLPRNLHTLIVGGENLNGALAQRVHDRFQGRVAIFNEYGPTEATVGCMLHRFRPGQDSDGSVPIGRPAANSRIYVLDDAHNPTDAGVVGDLHIGGAGLAQGYLGQPDLTAMVFPPSPVEGGARLYRSGDRARRLPDGTVEFIGRADGQIKVGGYRIELGEIRHAVLAFPGVTDGVVRLMGRPGERGVLIADYVSETPVDAGHLRAFLEARLLPAAVPQAFVHHREFPLTANGKVDIRALEQRSAVDHVADRDEPPVTPTEIRLAPLWRAALRVARIGRRRSFFDLGGDSLSAVDLFAAIETEFGLTLPISTLVRAPTLELLSTIIDGSREISPTPLVTFRSAGRRRPLFLVHGIGGEVLGYEPLVNGLAPDQPVYGLRGETLDVPLGQPFEIEAMASDYLRAMEAAHHEGPYRLCGYSAGGLIAFEMARQLRASGRVVDSLIVIDGDAPQEADAQVGSASVVERLRQRGFWLVDELAPSVRDALTGPGGRAALGAAVRRNLPRLGRAPASEDIRDRLGLFRMSERSIGWLSAFSLAIARYQPTRYDGTLALIRARTFGLSEPLRPDRGWSRWVRDLRVTVIRGNHASILREPLVRSLASAVTTALNGPR